MTTVEEIIKLGKVKPAKRCPICHSPYLTRRAVKQDGVNLWNLDEWCSMNGCNWHGRTLKNVRVD